MPYRALLASVALFTSAVVVIVIVLANTPVTPQGTQPSGPDSSPSATAIVSSPTPLPTLAPTRVLLSGSYRSVPFPAPAGLRYVNGVLTDGHYVVATYGDGQSSFAYVLLDLTTGATRTLPAPAAGVFGGPIAIADGRIGFSEIARSTTGESYSYAIEDLATGSLRTLDTSDAPGHFHAQGSPLEPDPWLVLGDGNVAYVHLFVQGPDLIGELRVGPLDGPMRTVTRSKLQVRPLALTNTTLAYTIPSTNLTASELHIYDIASGRDRIATRGQLGFEVALAGNRLLYTLQAATASEAGREIVQDLSTGSETMIAGGSCNSPSLNDRYAAINCSDPNLRPHTLALFDLVSGARVPLAESTDIIGNARLAPGAVTWFRYDSAMPPDLFVETLRY